MAEVGDDPARDDAAPTPSDRPVPPGKLRGEEKQWGALAHVAVVAGLVFPVIGGPAGPLVVRIAKGKESAFVEANAVEALNFGILLAAAQLVVSVLTGSVLLPAGGLGVFGSFDTLARLLPLVVTVAALVLPGMAALQANNGRMGRYPEAMPGFVRPDDDGGADQP